MTYDKLKKGFGRVPREVSYMLYLCVEEWLVTAIMALLENVTAAVKIKDYKSC